MILAAKALALILGIIAISKSYHDFRKKEEGLTMFLFWLTTWSAIIVVTLYPILIDKFNALVGDQGSSINTFLGASIVALFFVVYRIYIKAHRIERQLHTIVMKLGLKELDKD